jgi:hypothetical protein
MPLTCSLYPFECQQIDEGVVFRVAGGLLLEHPLTLPFVEAVVSVYLTLFFTSLIYTRHFKLMQTWSPFHVGWF